MDKEKKHLIGLIQFPKFGLIKMKKIQAFFQSWEDAFNSSAANLIKAGIEEKNAAEFISFKQTLNLDKTIETIEKESIKIITIENEEYPALLKEIYDPPFLLFTKGNLPKPNEFCLAVVGSRKISKYGEMATEKIVSDLTKNGLTIVSGLAYGVDTVAHFAAVKGGGKTIAVLGTGVDKKSIYPKSNLKLSQDIIDKGGAIISEFPIEAPPLSHHFPQRNRIISGLSLGSLIVEANEKSGALITARFALEQNREVFAIPGSIFSPASIGPNNLIKQGARVVTCAEDILDALDLEKQNNYIENKTIIPETEEEKIILSFLSHEPTHINEIIRLSKFNSGVVSSTLILMEMKGMVKNIGGMEYVKK